MTDKSREESTIVPFLRWAGGKRWFISKHSELLPKRYERLIEPFLGAGSVFFHLKPPNALLGDINCDLIETYRSIQQNWRSLRRSLQHRHRAHRFDPDEYYYRVRAQSPKSAYARASRLIYLNRTCFNGIY